VEGSPRLQPSRLRGDVRGSGGVPAESDRGAAAADAARSDLVAALEGERRGFGSVKGEIRLLCNHLQTEVRTAADERFHAYYGEVTGRVTANLPEAMAGWKGHLGRVSREVEKNLSRVAAQWADAVGASIDGFFRDATEFLGREVETIAGLVGEADAGNRLEEVRAALAELAAAESSLGTGAGQAGSVIDL
jgi:hypothetical protein